MPPNDPTQQPVRRRLTRIPHVTTTVVFIQDHLPSLALPKTPSLSRRAVGPESQRRAEALRQNHVQKWINLPKQNTGRTELVEGTPLLHGSRTFLGVYAPVATSRTHSRVCGKDTREPNLTLIENRIPSFHPPRWWVTLELRTVSVIGLSLLLFA
jgi:hypothetical protein